MRIFLDANVLFSAGKSDGAVRQLIDLLIAAGHECVADAYVVEEARRNLAMKSAPQVASLTRLLQRLEVSRLHPQMPAAPALIALPEKDRPVLAAAIALGCAALVTGDRTHFGQFYGKELAGVRIHSPRSLAEALLPPT